MGWAGARARAEGPQGLPIELTLGWPALGGDPAPPLRKASEAAVALSHGPAGRGTHPPRPQAAGSVQSGRQWPGLVALGGRATPVRRTVAPPAHHHDWRSSDKVTFTVLKLDSDVNGASRTHRASRLRQLYLYGVGFCWNGEAELLLPGQRATAPRRCAPWAIGTPLDFPRPRHLAAAPRELSRPHRPR